MLHADRPSGDQSIEAPAIERSCHHLVIAGRSNPVGFRTRSSAKRAPDRLDVPRERQSYGIPAGSEGKQMQVMIVEPGQQGGTAALDTAIDRSYPGTRRKHVGYTTLANDNIRRCRVGVTDYVTQQQSSGRRLAHARADAPIISS
jgi:hypothetical protein